MKRILIAALLLLFTIETAAAEIKDSKKIYIPVITKQIDTNFFQLIKAGTEQAAESYDIETTFDGAKLGEPAEVQLNKLNSVLSQKPQAIVLTALDSKAAAPYLEEAQAAGIPVIGLDTGVDSPIVKTTVSTNNYDAGAFAAEKMGQLLNGKGKVGIVALDRISKVAEARTTGFVDTLQNNYPNIEILPPKYNSDSVVLAKARTKALLTEHPDIAGIYAQGDDISTGVIQAIKELQKEGQVTIIGFDSSKTLSDAVREGTVAGAVSQDPVGMGYLAIQAALKAYKGETLPEFIDSGFFWYDKSNIDSPEIQPYLFE